MNIILLSGGSGKRLWPLSNDIRSKQFLKLFKEKDGYESMVQRVYRQIKEIDPQAKVTIATAKTQVSAIHNQIGYDIGISVEPYRRDTFPAIALATAYLNEIQGVSSEEAVVVCPVDPYVDDDYFRAIEELYVQATKSDANLILMGIEPTYPSEKYGYIIPKTKDSISEVITFKEKPEKKAAMEYISQGALWNGGVFAYKLKYVLDRAHELIEFNNYQDMFNKYHSLKKISFDYAVVENEPNIEVMRFNGRWMDVGTWNTITEVMEDVSIGKVAFNENCENVNVLNELDIPILCMGLKDIVVSASPEGILVSDKEQSSYIKSYVDAFDGPTRFAEKSWGAYKVIDVEHNCLSIKISLENDRVMNYHSHDRRDEVWIVVSGKGIAVIDGQEKGVREGDVLIMRAGTKHSIKALEELKLIEIQLGSDISVEDKKKYDYEWITGC